MPMMAFVVFIHLLYVLFMVAGFVLTVDGLVRRTGYLGWKWFRTLHLLGILLVIYFAVQGEPCLLTVWEEQLRAARGMESRLGSFIAYYLEKAVYPDVPPLMILIPTYIVALVSVGAYVFRSPWNKTNTGKTYIQPQRRRDAENN